ncbi:NADPH-dependent FMN reductase [Methanoculleus taiwanensis]|uniref:NADPH-dependent FMN reductase n=1 Tax=Methanoculleus taiwanensis TaxID=1550565 RepID=A0A498GYT0_9EURY|nr:flavodoxin family protein [Methanoculleus taiwanensis]RXE55573.1 NADPH-dependent FMN reductase [Methanoculleus taiwanensis]
MEVKRVPVESRTVETPIGPFIISLVREDLGGVYPGMRRYTVEIRHAEQCVYRYVINSYEQPPHTLFSTDEVAEIVFGRLAYDVAARPQHYTEALAPVHRALPGGTYDVVILQGSPRQFGSSATLAGWCADEASRQNRSAHIFSVHEMEIRPCSGCYVCYNQGICPIDDDMPVIIKAIETASLLIIATPVYTNTVPAGLKAVIDRGQALHARHTLLGRPSPGNGLLIAIAGRPGPEPFECTRSVTNAFMRNIGIHPAGEITIDRMDTRRDVRAIEGLEERVRTAVASLL